MQAAVLTKAGFEIRDLDQPSCGEGQLLIKVTACGICSGDLFVYRNRTELAATKNRLGHEGSGRVVAVGDGVTGLAPGDVVTTLGEPAYADYLVTTPDKVVKLPPEVDPVPALGEAVACCVHAAGRFGTRPGDRVAVVGCGFMGLVCLQLAKHQEAGFVCAFDPVAYRRDMSRQLGAAATVDPSATTASDILRRYGEFDVVIEAAGNQSALDLCTELVTKHGRLILIGYHQTNGGMRTVNMERWNYKAIDVVNGHVRRQAEKVEAMRQGVELMRQGHLVTAPLITTYNLTDIEAAFQALTSQQSHLFKAVVVMD